MKKTVKIEYLINKANYMLANSTNKPEFRQGIQAFIESVLHDNNCYDGFYYLTSLDMIEGYKPGINYDILPDRTIKFIEDYEKRFLNTDRTRVNYHINNLLTK